MPLFIGVLADNGVNRLYISSVSADDDKFEGESVLADCSPRGKKDYATAKQDLYILRNKLTNGDVPHKVIVMED